MLQFTDGFAVAGAQCLYPLTEPAPKSTPVRKKAREALRRENRTSNDRTESTPLLPAQAEEHDLSGEADLGVEPDPCFDFDFNDAIFSQPYMWPSLSFPPEEDNQPSSNEDKPSDNNSIHTSKHMDGWSIASAGGGVIFAGDPAPSALGSTKHDSDGELCVLPDISMMTELLEIFFAQYHKYLPCVHRTTLFHCIKQDRKALHRSPLMLSLLALASRFHRDTSIQSRSLEWLALAKRSWQQNAISTADPTTAIQAAVWILFQDILGADINEAWLFLGTACRFASMIGFDRMDSQNPPACPAALRPKDALEKETRRRAMWSLYTLDKVSQSVSKCVKHIMI